jgi:hypothetical protein
MAHEPALTVAVHSSRLLRRVGPAGRRGRIWCFPWYDDEIARTFDLMTALALHSDKIAMVCYAADSVSYSSPAAKRFLVTALERSPSRMIRGLSCLAPGRHAWRQWRR